MQTNAITHYSFSIPEIESFLQAVEQRLQTFALTEAKFDGQLKPAPSELTYKVKVEDYVEGQIREAISFIDNRLQVASNIVNTVEAEKAAYNECVKMNREATDIQVTIEEKEKEKCHYTVDPFKTKYEKGMWPLAIGAAAVDGSISYANYRVEYPVLLSATAATALAAIIALSHKVAVPFILKPKERRNRILRFGLVAAGASALFYIITRMRIDSLNSAVNTSLEAGQPTIVHEWLPLFIISAGLFFLVLGYGLLVWKSKEERASEETHKNLCAEIEALQRKKTTLENGARTLEAKILQQKAEGRFLHEYRGTSVGRAKQIGDNAVKVYRQTFAKHSPNVPDYFKHPPALVYDEPLHFSPQNDA